MVETVMWLKQCFPVIWSNHLLSSAEREIIRDIGRSKQHGWKGKGLAYRVVEKCASETVKWNDGSSEKKRDREHGSSTRAKFLYNSSNTQHA